MARTQQRCSPTPMPRFIALKLTVEGQYGSSKSKWTSGCGNIEPFTRTISVLRRLKALGVRIAMDDFGTGYSSLSYLQSFPFDKIKIDKSFVWMIQKNPQSTAIVRAIVGLGRDLAMRILAEGVETLSQLNFLKDEGCNSMQGYFICCPCPIETYAKEIGRFAA